MTLQLLPPETPTLRYTHIEEVVKLFPQQENGVLNYVVAAGGAVMLLCEAHEVNGYKVIDKTANNRRLHKDLELYAFNSVFGALNPNPHDLVKLFSDNTLHKMSYKEEEGEVKFGAKDFTLIIEILRGSYYDSPIPKEEDTVLITTEMGNHFFTLRPEFLIATKLFSANGLRKGLDDQDALALLKRFKLDEAYLFELIRNSELCSVYTPTTVKKLIEAVENGTFYEDVSNEIDRLYGEKVPEIKSLQYHEKVSILRFDPNDLALSPMKKAYIWGAYAPGNIFSELHPLCLASPETSVFRQCLSDLGAEEEVIECFIQEIFIPSEYLNKHLRQRLAIENKDANFHKLWQRYFFSELCIPEASRINKRYEKKLSKIDRPFLLIGTWGNPIKRASAIKQTIAQLQKLYKDETSEDYKKLSLEVANKVSETLFLHVFTAALMCRIQQKIEEGAHSITPEELFNDFQ